jgi:excinuclease UvrABC ATPase subunit
MGVLYILDEPSIGLHPRDTNKLVEILRKLNEKGNSVFVVEHDPYIMSCADFVVDVGPKAGKLGGEIIYAGDFEGLKHSGGLTAEYLNNPRLDNYERKKAYGFIEIKNATLHNLKNVSTKIPKGVLTCVTGVAGSGKSSLINEKFIKENKEAIVIDQSGIGKSSRSNPATYIGVFSEIREEIAKATGKSAALFSFNSKGACPKCKGQGQLSIEMHFLDDVKITCSECHGKKYTDEVLKIKYKGKNIYEILNMTIAEAKDFFESKEIKRKLQVLCDVGLEYLELGQPLSTLSGGECQRIKLASELHKKGNVYVMDEPTTGLHMADIHKLLTIIKNLVDKGNTVVVIEHNLDVIKNADWIIDLGPEGGSKGGKILFEGTPDELVKCKESYTGKYLNEINKNL